MPVSKKPKKRRVPKPVLLPLGMKRANVIELPVQLALEALGTEWFGESHLAEILVHAEVVRDGATDLKMRETGRWVFNICRDIAERYSRKGKFGCTGDELTALREGLKLIIPYVRKMPNSVIYKLNTR